MKKIAYVSGTRADFGLMFKTLSAIDSDKQFMLDIYATGMHLINAFGYTFKEIKKKFPQTKIVKTSTFGDSRKAMAMFVGECEILLVKFFSQDKPDLILSLGDRGEQLASAVAAAYLGIPVAHIHGGDISGTVDNPTRYAISQLSKFHFTASKKSAANLKKILIDKKNIYAVGAPGIEEIKEFKTRNKKKQIVILQHPAEDEKLAATQIKTTLQSAVKFNIPVVVIYPNSDAGGRAMIKTINNFSKKYKFLKIHPTLERKEFLKLLAFSSVLAGNSSAGIIEAPSLKLPVVNIGERQKGREKASNIIDVGYDRNQIYKAIDRSLNDRSYLKRVSIAKNPYDFGKTSHRILEIIKNLIKDDQI